MESRQRRKPSDDTVSPLIARQSDHRDRPGYAETGVLDQVRDLLFGDQARETDHRMQAVEARLTASVEQLREQLREEMLERIEALNRELGERMDQLEEHVSAQEAEWRDANRTLLQRIEEIRTELSECLVKESKDLAEQITDEQRKTMAYVDRTVNALEKAKADRDALARLFAQLASQLEGKD